MKRLCAQIICVALKSAFVHFFVLSPDGSGAFVTFWKVGILLF